ncbi:hypothetical protein YB2330_004547 [Saitoella coloradoensis]
MPRARVYPDAVYDTSYSLFRLSPLYGFGLISLPTHGRELTKLVRQSLTSAAAAVIAEENTGKELDHVKATKDDVSGVVDFVVSFDGGKKVYHALLLPPTTNAEVLGGSRKRRRDYTTRETATAFDHFPLLLLRVPAVVTAVFTHYLTTRFDARCTALRIPSGALQTTFLNPYLSNATEFTGPLQLTYLLPSVGCKRFTISVPGGDLASIREHAADMSSTAIPVLQKHLECATGMSLDKDGVEIVKVACATFVVSGEGKIKVFGKNREGVDVGWVMERIVGAAMNGVEP